MKFATKSILRSAALAIVIPLVCHQGGIAANFQTVKAGNWSDPTVWGFDANSGLYPGSGGSARPDTVILYASVLVDVSATIGLGNVPNHGSYDLQVSAPLTIDMGQTLTLRGSVLEYAPIQLNPGGGLVFDSSISNVGYGIRCYTNASTFIANGTATARCTVSSIGQPASINNSYINASFHATFTDFTAFNPSCGVTSAAQGAEFTVEDCTLNSCDFLNNFGGFASSAKLSIQRNTWTNSTGTYSMSLNVVAAPASGVRHIVTGNVFDKLVEFHNGVVGLTITNNYFNDGFIDGDTRTRWSLFTGNFVRHTYDGLHWDGDILNNYFFYDNPSKTDCNALRGGDVGNVLAYGNIFEARTADNTGCWAYMGAGSGLPTKPTLYVLRNNIMILNAGNSGSSGSLAVIEDHTPFISVLIEHNTVSADPGMLLVGDFDSSSAGQVLSCRSNIAWSGGNGLIYRDLGYVADVCPPAKIGFNCGFNLRPSNPGAMMTTLPLKPGYGGKNTNIFSVTPLADSTDLNIDPGFVDSARGLAKWDASLGGPGTVDDALAKLKLINQTPRGPYKISSLLAYIKGGFQPTNTGLRRAGHDGADIGAMPVLVAPLQQAVAPTP